MFQKKVESYPNRLKKKKKRESVDDGGGERAEVSPMGERRPDWRATRGRRWERFSGERAGDAAARAVVRAT